MDTIGETRHISGKHVKTCVDDQRDQVSWTNFLPAIFCRGGAPVAHGTANAKSPANAGLFGIWQVGLDLVAGAGFEPATFRL